MKKSIYIIILCSLQAACSSVGDSLPEAPALLTFGDLDREISVRHEVLDGTVEVARSVAGTR